MIETSVPLTSRGQGQSYKLGLEMEPLVASPLTADPYADAAAEEGKLIAHTLRGEGFDASEDGTGRGCPAVPAEAVRRLTPVECERLMGFSDGWTEGDAQGVAISDGPRYRMLGNSVAVPVVEWIGRRLAAVERKLALDKSTR